MTADTLTPAADARLRAALGAAATTAPVPDAWEAILARVAGDEITADPSTGRSRTRVLALAAAVLALLAVGAVVVATRPDGSTVVTDETTTEPAPTATGWYVPVDLPAGWVVEEIIATRRVGETCTDGSEPGAVDSVVWTAAPRARISLQGWACPPIEGEDDIPSRIPMIDVDLGGGVTSEMLDPAASEDPGGTISWTDDGRAWTMDGAGLTTEELVAAARGAVADGPLETTPEGFTEADRWSTPAGPSTEVGVTLVGPSGTRMAYRLNGPGHGIARTAIDPQPYSLPGQDLPIARTWEPNSSWYAMKVFGAWPGADLDIMVLVAAEPAPGSADEQTEIAEVDELVAHLRPATTAEWRTFLKGFDHTPVLDRADTFADLAGLDIPPPGLPPEDESGPTTTTTAPG